MLRARPALPLLRLGRARGGARRRGAVSPPSQHQGSPHAGEPPARHLDEGGGPGEGAGAAAARARAVFRRRLPASDRGLQPPRAPVRRQGAAGPRRRRADAARGPRLRRHVRRARRSPLRRRRRPVQRHPGPACRAAVSAQAPPQGVRGAVPGGDRHHRALAARRPPDPGRDRDGGARAAGPGRLRVRHGRGRDHLRRRSRRRAAQHGGAHRARGPAAVRHLGVDPGDDRRQSQPDPRQPLEGDPRALQDAAQDPRPRRRGPRLGHDPERRPVRASSA